MGIKPVTDFIIETRKRCFLCLDQLEPGGKQLINVSEKVTIHSLQSISRYLGLDTSKLFMKEYAISPELLSAVNRTLLKVNLCEECISINDSFSKAYIKLEKIEMELACSLKFILTKLEKAVERERVEELQSLTELVESFNEGKLQIAEALRRQTLNKCSRKLARLHPRARVQKLTGKEVDEEKLKVKNNWRNDISNPTDNDKNIDNTATNHKIGVKSEGSTYPPSISDHQDSDYANDPSYDSLTMMDSESGSDEEDSPKVHHVLKYEETMERKYDQTDSGVINNVSPDPVVLLEMKIESDLKTSSCKMSNLKVSSQKVTPKFPKNNFDPKTGTHYCGLCPKTFTTRGGYRLHYKATHLKIRYKCEQCSKLFTTQTFCKEHQRRVHRRIHLQCQKCQKLFADPSNLRKHIRRIHLNQREYSVSSTWRPVFRGPNKNSEAMYKTKVGRKS